MRPGKTQQAGASMRFFGAYVRARSSGEPTATMRSPLTATAPGRRMVSLGSTVTTPAAVTRRSQGVEGARGEEGARGSVMQTPPVGSYAEDYGTPEARGLKPASTVRCGYATPGWTGTY